MSRTTRVRVRVISQSLLASFTRPQAVMTCDVGSLYGAAAAIAAGTTLTSTQVSALEAARQVLGGGASIAAARGMSAHDRTLLAQSVSAMADAAATEQRGLVAATLATTLRADNWIVTVVDGGDPDRYTGIEATRGTEHLVAAVGPGELITDQAGAHDCDATVDTIVTGLQAIGWSAAIADDVRHDGTGGSLYALSGGPTKAHAVQATLRRDAVRMSVARHGSTPSALRITAG
jgi:hypothetical protein